ncbi:MAG: thiolase family protein [Fidelibacterota bacterium]
MPESSHDRGYSAHYENVYLLGGARTPFGKFCGTLGTVSPTDLGILAAREAIGRSGVDPGEIDHVVFANIIQAGFDAIYLPRHIGLYCGIPPSVPAMMVQRICASGFEAIVSAGEQIVLGKAGIVLAGGSENMTRAPTSSFGNRLGYRLGQLEFGDMLWEGLKDPAVELSMGQTAENLARKYGITREEADTYALRSHRLALASSNNGVLSEEMVAVASGVLEMDGFTPRSYRTNPPQAKLERDEGPRETDMDKLAQLPAVFDTDGIQTAGNSSAIVDGAAAAVVASGDVIEARGLTPLARIVASASTGVDPRYMGIGPVPAIRKVLEVSGLSLDTIDLFEINEAFAAQIIAVERELNLDRNRLNVHGGAIAIGHPLAATGTRLILTLALELGRRGERYGIASACVGGGQGTAVVVENTNLENGS